jgi:hypothetical protein
MEFGGKRCWGFGVWVLELARVFPKGSLSSGLWRFVQRREFSGFSLSFLPSFFPFSLPHSPLLSDSAADLSANRKAFLTEKSIFP